MSEPPTVNRTVAAVFADGGCIKVNPSPLGGTWAFLFVDAEEQLIREHCGVLRPEVVRLPAVSNNVSELYALVRAILNTPFEFNGTFYSDSWCSLCRVFQAGRLNGVPDWLAEATSTARNRLRHFAGFRWQLLDGHPTRAQLASGIGKRGNPCSKWNVRCDTLCRDRAEGYLRSLKGD